MNLKIRSFVVLALASGVVASSQALTLFNTGVGLTRPGNLQVGTTVDSYWYYGDASGNRLAGTADDAYAYWNSAYGTAATENAFIANAGESEWLGTNQGSSNTTYYLTLAFDLTGYDLNTVSFSGLWSSDNSSQLTLNGSLVASRPYPGWNGVSSFSVPSASGSLFNSGMNYLQIRVLNESGPMAGRLEFSSVSGSVVPEPFTMALGAAGIGLAMRRRMKKKA